MSTPSKVVCGECACSRVIANDNKQMLECHRRSPVWGNGNNGMTAVCTWPRVRPDDFCFEGIRIQCIAPPSRDQGGAGFETTESMQTP